MLPGETDKEHSGRVITALLRIDPTDELEYMIATQLVGLHNLAIQTMGHAAGSTKVARGCPKMPFYANSSEFQ